MKRFNKLLVLISVLLVASTLLFIGLLKQFRKANVRSNTVCEYRIAEEWETQNGRGNEVYIIKITELTEGNGAITISNFSNLGSDIKATCSNRSITINSQRIDIRSEPLVVQGAGFFCGDSLQFTYYLTGGDRNFKAICVGQRIYNSKTDN